MVAADVAVLGVAIGLANLPERPTHHEVNLVMTPLAHRARRATSSQWNPATASLMPAIRADLAFLRSGFESIRSGGRPPEKKHREYLESVSGAVTLAIVKGGRQMELSPEWTGVASVVGYALGLLIDRRYDARKRLGKCKECGDYFFDDHTGPGRFRTDFCSTTHNDAFAQRAKRERAKALKQEGRSQ